MSGLNMEIRWETRLCEINGELGYFHTWEHWSNVVDSSPLRGGHPKQHSHGKHGEHAHDYVYDEEGKLIKRPIRELTEEEREENDDIL